MQELYRYMAQFETEYPGDALYLLHRAYRRHRSRAAPCGGHNEMVRQYVQQNGGVLFDFADIESYDPEGNFYPIGLGRLRVVRDWCTAHPDQLRVPEPAVLRPHQRPAVHPQSPGFLVADGSPGRLGWGFVVIDRLSMMHGYT